MKVYDLLFRILGKVLVLLESYLLVDLKDGVVAEADLEVLKRKYSLHSHEEGYPCFNWKDFLRVRKGVLLQKLVELPDLLATE